MDEQAKDLALYRLEKARQCAKSAEYVMQINDYNLVTNRAYYAIFHGMRAVLALERKDFEKMMDIPAGFLPQMRAGTR